MCVHVFLSIGRKMFTNKSKLAQTNKNTFKSGYVFSSPPKMWRNFHRVHLMLNIRNSLESEQKRTKLINRKKWNINYRQTHTHTHTFSSFLVELGNVNTVD